jgi:mono/diheme cytochrome c family protein
LVAQVEAAAPVRPTVALGRVGDGRTGSTVVLAHWGERRVALVADGDDHAVRTLDVDARRELGVTRLTSRPGQMLVAADGRLLVTMREEGTLAAFHASDDPTSPLVPAGSAPTAVEPIGLAATPDDASVLVVSGWGHTFESFALDGLKRSVSLDLPREPRAVTTSSDGATAFVAHAVAGQVTVISLHADAGARTLGAIDLTTGSWQGGDDTSGPDFPARVSRNAFAIVRLDGKRERIFVPHSSVDPGGAVGFSTGYGSTSVTESGTHAFDVDTIDPRKRALVTGDRMPWIAQDVSRSGKGACLLPRAAAVDAARTQLLVSCLGIDEVRAYDATKDDPTGWKPRRRWSVPAGTEGIAVDPEANEAIVWSSFDGVVSVLPLSGGDVTDGAVLEGTAIPITRTSPLPADVALGRRLFFDAGDPRIAKDGRACASCHVDGREDGLVWSSPDGPRQTILLGGRAAHAPPFGWLGQHASMQLHIAQTVKNLSGTGLDDHEIDALTAWVKVMPGPPAPEHTATALEAHGREIFAAGAADCGSCHVGRLGFTDDKTHDVGSARGAERIGAFVTPSLRFVGGTAPYFHDGRYATLEDLLRDRKSHMGGTATLAPADVDAMAAYLRTL